MTSVLIFSYMSNKMQRHTVYFIWKLLYMFRVVPPPIIRSANNCIYSIWYLWHRYYNLPLSWIYSIWYLSHRYCYLPATCRYRGRVGTVLSLLWVLICFCFDVVADVSTMCNHIKTKTDQYPQHSQTSSNSSTIAAGSSNDVTNTKCCRYSCLLS